jgi:T5SS/PEP-CTERM-associated repeat protein
MKRSKILFLIAGVLISTGAVVADDYNWINSLGGMYSGVDNWSPTGVPGSSDNAYFNLADYYTVTLDANYAVYKIVFDAGQVMLDLNGFQYDIERASGQDAANIGYNADAELTVFNAGHVYSGDTVIGREPTSHGILNIRGAGTVWQVKRGDDWYSLFIGGNGRGDMNISEGGMMDYGAGSVATLNPSRAFVTVDGLGSVWRVDGYLAIGDQGIADVQVRNQGEVNVGRCDMGSNPGSQAFMVVTGKDSENNSEFYLRSWSETSLTIGSYGAAWLTFNNKGKLVNEGNLAMAAHPGSYGELNVSQSWADVWHSMSVGGTLDTPGGTAVVNILRNGLLSIGEIDPGDSLVVWPGGTVNLCEGELNLDILGTPSMMALHGRLAGVGMVWADVINSDGVVAPGSGFTITPELQIGADYTQGSKAKLEITIAHIPSTTPPQSYYGKLYVTAGGVASLDGFLNVSLNDYVPAPTDSFMIVSAPAGVTGRFANTPGNVYIFSGGTFDVQYNPTSVVLTNFRSPACANPPRADLNGDCIVDLLDFAILASEWLTDGLTEPTGIM